MVNQKFSRVFVCSTCKENIGQVVGQDEDVYIGVKTARKYTCLWSTGSGAR